MEHPIQTFEPNVKGRDFVVGDMHGALSCFENLMRNLKFDKSVDRMFSVGDLVDRGPDSIGCLRLMNEPWFHAVLSNHEQMMYEAFNGGYNGRYWFENGGKWGLKTYNMSRDLEALRHGRIDHEVDVTDLDMEVLDALIQIEHLPFLITIKMKDGKKFHIIHAELPHDEGEVITDEMLTSPEKVMELATRQTRDGDHFLWGRHKFMAFYKTDLSNVAKLVRTVNYDKYVDQFNDGLSHIISGHTIMHRPVTLVGQTNIDTGAYYVYPDRNEHGYEKVPKWAGLTCVELATWKFYKATPTDFKEVQPLEINTEDLVF